MSDIELKGAIVKYLDNSVIFLDFETGLEIDLPRDQIAIVEDVAGELVTMPIKLAIAKGVY